MDIIILKLWITQSFCYLLIHNIFSCNSVDITSLIGLINKLTSPTTIITINYLYLSLLLP